MPARRTTLLLTPCPPQCDVLVGTFSSQLSRLALELMVARHGVVPPYASVDYPWCSHFMEVLDVPGFGPKHC